MRPKDIISLNKTIITGMSIDELESRLQMEEIDARSEMWTGCGCADVCYGQWDPNQNCVPYACGAKGTW